MFCGDEDDEYGKVLVDRNRVIQLAVDEWNERRMPVNGTKADWQPWFNHWLNIYRVKEITGDESDPQYGWRWVWKRKGADHWALSTIYALVGRDRFMESMATIIKPNTFITPAASRIDGSIPARRVGIQPPVQW